MQKAEKDDAVRPKNGANWADYEANLFDELLDVDVSDKVLNIDLADDYTSVNFDYCYGPRRPPSKTFKDNPLKGRQAMRVCKVRPTVEQIGVN